MTIGIYKRKQIIKSIIKTIFYSLELIGKITFSILMIVLILPIPLLYNWAFEIKNDNSIAGIFTGYLIETWQKERDFFKKHFL